MKLIGTATILKELSGIGFVSRLVVGRATLKTLSPETPIVDCPEYDLIDGGFPGTVYAPINGFNLIDGGTP